MAKLNVFQREEQAANIAESYHYFFKDCILTALSGKQITPNLEDHVKASSDNAKANVRCILHSDVKEGTGTIPFGNGEFWPEIDFYAAEKNKKGMRTSYSMRIDTQEQYKDFMKERRQQMTVEVKAVRNEEASDLLLLELTATYGKGGLAPYKDDYESIKITKLDYIRLDHFADMSPNDKEYRIGTIVDVWKTQIRDMLEGNIQFFKGFPEELMSEHSEFVEKLPFSMDMGELTKSDIDELLKSVDDGRLSAGGLDF